MFRAKLEAVARAAGWRVTRQAPAQLAVVELDAPAAVARVRELVHHGLPVIAFGSHVNAAALRAAREAGAEAVPNSRLEAVVRARLTST
ncbi:MAG: hypothetical protein A2W29_10595 [Gemmatimonadetes bacterium RBG_16_66_8]|nr:MAG: hypothetical protein A2W29_10595 [Gemmatimonadetes bacterium RBG_16_66_8]